MIKPYLSTWRLRLAGGLAVCAAVSTVVACDFGNGNTESTSPISGEPPPLGTVLRVAYDETSVTTGTQWPSDISTGKSASTEDELLIHYSSTHQAYEFGDDGDLATQTDFLEGNARTWLPADFHDALGDELPVPGGDDPITRYEIQGGTYRALRASGAVAVEKAFGADAFRIPAEWVAAIRAARDSAAAAGSPATRIAQNRQALEAGGIVFRELAGDRVVIEQAADDGTTIRSVLNLRTNMPEIIESVRPDGRRESAEIRTYQDFDRMPIATRVVTYRYGDAAGTWGVERKTELTRTNVVVNR